MGRPCVVSASRDGLAAVALDGAMIAAAPRNADAVIKKAGKEHNGRRDWKCGAGG
jgi:hypothetical protein